MQKPPIAAPAPPSRRPDFGNLLKALRREVPSRPTLFELFLNDDLYYGLTANLVYDGDPNALVTYNRRRIDACALCGYDYATVAASRYAFPSKPHGRDGGKTYSLNESSWIVDWPSFRDYPWPDPAWFDPSDHLAALGRHLPDGMKLMIIGPGGVLENAILLMGYETLCAQLYEEPELVNQVFARIGERILRYYEAVLPSPEVGGLILNDDWGFNTQPMLAPDDMRRLVFPWYQKITEISHKAGKPVVLHSCGRPDLIMEDITGVMKIDGRHSYEDAIQPVEEFYEQWHEKIAVVGGIDVDFLCRRTPEEVRARAEALLARTGRRGGYLLGSGNSIPYYVPLENYFAMISAAF